MKPQSGDDGRVAWRLTFCGYDKGLITKEGRER